MFSLIGKRALVCGSTQGIGRACAEALALQGAEVTLVARDAAALPAVCSELDRAAEQTHGWVAADFADPGEVHERIAEHVDKTGPIEILVNNTGGPRAGAVYEATFDDFISAIQMHLFCNHALVRAVVPGMHQRGFGRIINIISTSVRQPIPGLGVSNTIRGAVASWAKTLSAELAPLGITVNNVLPGYTTTARLQALIEAKAQHFQVTPEEVEQSMKLDIPVGRFALPSEIAAAVAFLASPEASYVTGVSFPVDGGRITAI